MWSAIWALTLLASCVRLARHYAWNGAETKKALRRNAFDVLFLGLDLAPGSH